MTFAAGAGDFERAYLTMTRGIQVDASAMAADTVAARFEAVSDWAGELISDGAFAQSAVALGRGRAWTRPGQIRDWPDFRAPSGELGSLRPGQS